MSILKYFKESSHWRVRTVGLNLHTFEATLTDKHVAIELTVILANEKYRLNQF